MYLLPWYLWISAEVRRSRPGPRQETVGWLMAVEGFAKRKAARGRSRSSWDRVCSALRAAAEVVSTDWRCGVSACPRVVAV